MTSIFSVRVPWPSSDCPPNGVLREYLAAWLRERRTLAPDLPGRGTLTSYRLSREDVLRGSKMAGETVSGFLRRLILTYDETVAGLHSAQRPAQAAPSFEIQKLAPAESVPAPREPLELVPLTLEEAKERLNQVGCPETAQPAWTYYLRGDSILADVGLGTEHLSVVWEKGT